MSIDLFRYRYNGEPVFPKEELKQFIDLRLTGGQATQLLKALECPVVYQDDNSDYRISLRVMATMLSQEEAMLALEFICGLKRNDIKRLNYISE